MLPLRPAGHGADRVRSELITSIDTAAHKASRLTAQPKMPRGRGDAQPLNPEPPAPEGGTRKYLGLGKPFTHCAQVVVEEEFPFIGACSGQDVRWGE